MDDLASLVNNEEHVNHCDVSVLTTSTYPSLRDSGASNHTLLSKQQGRPIRHTVFAEVCIIAVFVGGCENKHQQHQTEFNKAH